MGTDGRWRNRTFPRGRDRSTFERGERNDNCDELVEELGGVGGLLGSVVEGLTSTAVQRPGAGEEG